MALALAVLLMAAGSAQMVVGVGGIYHDDGVYISTAKALAEGQGYRLINLPDAPVQTKYPLLYPVLLALIWKLWPAFPDNLLAMQWLTLLLGAVTVGLAYLYMVRGKYFSPGVGVAATLCCITAPFFLFFCTMALSEIPFALLMILAMWGLDKALALPTGGRSAQLVLGCLLALPFLTRPIGIVFAPVGLALLSAFVRHVQEQYRGWWKPVYRGEDDRFVIFELQSDREPAAMPQHTDKAVLDAYAL
jgi:hypothetical protein